MAIPSTNQSFRQGDFTGFHPMGRCMVVENFSFTNPETGQTEIIRPFGRGKCFALLDDPTLVDDDGARLPSSGIIPVPADTSAYQFDDDFSGQTTFGIDGAILEVTDVSIPRGKKLFFRSRFLPFDSSAAGMNDFALFDTYEGNQATPDTLQHREILGQANDGFAANGHGKWEKHTWAPASDFNGVLRWVVSNGTTQNPPVISNTTRARPSALLIDIIKIVSA
ncbi:MAG TPA: hypothetical protein ENJ86_02180 [Methylothermaceae bacterium]|nr:hypothetical protein [Methylothermaceae bacterium]